MVIIITLNKEKYIQFNIYAFKGNNLIVTKTLKFIKQ